jgi:parallel beta-helix repeat protein
VFHLTGGGAVLENLLIEGDDTPLTSFDIKDMAEKNAGILIESNANTVSGVAVRRLHNGLLIFGNGNDVRGSEFSGNAVIGAAVRSGNGNVFTDSSFEENGIYGLFLGWLNDPALANDMQAWFKVLRTLKNVEKNTVEGNSFTGNGFAGLILAQAAFENEISGNTATGNGGAIPVDVKPWSRGAGIYLSCGPMRNVISENDVRGNDNSGITIDPGFDNIFRNNRITDNTSMGFSVSASTGNRFEGNAVSGHADYGIIFRRWVTAQLPAANNLLTGNALSRNRINADDESGVAFELPDLGFVNEESRRRTLAIHSVANRWDDGARGNYYDDFDEEAEGFTDRDGDGVGETPHPIPGGAAVDNHPLAQAPEGLGMAPAAPGAKLTAAETICLPLGACGSAASSCGP